MSGLGRGWAEQLTSPAPGSSEFPGPAHGDAIGPGQFELAGRAVVVMTEPQPKPSIEQQAVAQGPRRGGYPVIHPGNRRDAQQSAGS
jgi:hypothetical protein